MQSLSDSFLSILNTFLQWVTIASMALAFFAAIGLFFVSNEMGRRQERILIEAEQKIAELQPKPLKDRVVMFLNALSPENLKVAKAMGTRTFKGSLNHAQIAELQKLCEEDKEGRFIKREPAKAAIGVTGNGQTIYSVRFTVTDELVK